MQARGRSLAKSLSKKEILVAGGKSIHNSNKAAQTKLIQGQGQGGEDDSFNKT
jgi:hypothetical protein